MEEVMAETLLRLLRIKAVAEEDLALELMV
jgi:hypothetical protein